MRHLIKPLFSLLLVCGSTAAMAQNAPFVDTTKKKIAPVPHIKRPKAVDRETSFGLRLNTNGWSIFADKGYVRSTEKNSDMFYNIRLFQVEFSEVWDPKELERTNTQLTTYSNAQSKPFKYGKINNFFALKLGFGGRKMIAGKPDPGALSIHLVYLGGLSLGMLKPYYIDAYVPDNSGTTSTEENIKYTDATKNAFLDKSNIIGSAGFSKGIGEISFVPGIHLKSGLHFDFSRNKHAVMAFETGIDVEIYSKPIALMADQDSKAYLVNAYASIQFGKRK